MRFNKIAVLVILCISLPSFGRSYKIYTHFIPERLDPETNQTNMTEMILWNLYEPLIRQSESGDFHSEVLDISKSKALNTTFRLYQLCLKDNVTYWNSKPVTITDFHRSMERNRKVVDGLSVVSRIKQFDQNCLHIDLKNRDIHFLQKLTGTTSSIYYWDQIEKRFPIGIGPYRPKEWTNEKIELEYIWKTPASFNRVLFQKYKFNDSQSNDEIEDWNHVPGSKVPDLISKGYYEVHVTRLKTYAIVINIEDPIKRKIANYCLSQIDTTGIVNQKLIPVNGFLPAGMLGSELTKVTFDGKNADCAKVDYPPWYDMRPAVIENIKNLKKKYPALRKIKVEQRDSSELSKLLFSGREWISIIGFDSSGNKDGWVTDSSVFFTAFTRSNGFLRRPLHNIGKLIERAAESDELQTKSTLFQNAHKNLLLQGFIIPLGQVQTPFYYHNKIKKVAWADRSTCVPQVNKFELNEN